MDGTVRICSFLLALPLIASGAPHSHPKVNAQAQLFKEFSDRVKQYAALQKKLESELPHLPDKADATAIAAHKKAMTESIRQSRASARPGDIFFPKVQPLFKRIIKANLAGPNGRAILHAIQTGNPKGEEGKPSKIRVAVNAPYPADEPLSNVPPELLLNLPQLPESVSYRFVGRDLILRDSKAALIADFIREVIR
jgi:hypothetical protein